MATTPQVILSIFCLLSGIIFAHAIPTFSSLEQFSALSYHHVRRQSKSTPKQPGPIQCAGVPFWNFSPENWVDARVDENLARFAAGGKDTEGLTWPGLKGTPNNLAAELGKQLLNSENFNCSLENPCTSDLNCNLIGQYPPNAAPGSYPTRSRWGYFALGALQHLNSQFSEVYSSIGDGEAGAAALTIKMTSYGHQVGSTLDIRNALLGIGTIFGAVGAYAPGVGPSVSTAGGIASSVGGFIGNAAATVNPLANPQAFGQYIADASDTMRKSLDKLCAGIFAGGPVGDQSTGLVSLQAMLQGGAWSTPQIDVSISSIANKTGVDLIARGVNSLWTKQKIFVMFLALGDTGGSTAKCDADQSGPQDGKHCEDGGVYYIVRFDETAPYQGFYEFPWGGDILGQIGLTLSGAVAGSARSFRQSKKLGGTGYNYDQIKGTFDTLTTSSPQGISTLAAQVGSLAGEWTVPVCDMGTWGRSSLGVYGDGGGTLENYGIDGDVPGQAIFPCICGADGSDTAAFVEASGMKNFGTLISACQTLLQKQDAWPPGVTSVNYGYGKPINRPS